MLTVAPSVFGNVHLGYVVIETEKFADWCRFGRDAVVTHFGERYAHAAWTAFLALNRPAQSDTKPAPTAP